MAENDITSFIDFKITENHIESKSKNFYFYRFFPPNLSILTPREKQMDIDCLSDFLEAIAMPIQIFAMDKAEDLSKNKAFFQNNTLSEYKEYTEQIVNQLSSYEMSDDVTSSIQRAYYFIVEFKDKDRKKIFDEALRTNHLKTKLICHDELVTLVRNYFIREFSNFDPYVFEKEVLEKYGS